MKMPELPDIVIYIERLQEFCNAQVLEDVAVISPFLLRTVDPAITALCGQRITHVTRLGKRIVWHFANDLKLVAHLMVAGRLQWLPPREKPPGRITLAVFRFANGNLVFTEASKKRRASLHVVRAEALAGFDRGGLDVLAATPAQFTERVRCERHTLKRALTDPTLFDGIGNAYSDEILHAAGLSPFAVTVALTDAECTQLHAAAVATLATWMARLRAEVGDGFPSRVTAFRPEMAVHGKYRMPCPKCGHLVQRIVYVENEANYCASCQTKGRLLSDRSLARLLHDDWPKTLAELEERNAMRQPAPTVTAAPGGDAGAGGGPPVAAAAHTSKPRKPRKSAR